MKYNIEGLPTDKESLEGLLVGAETDLGSIKGEETKLINRIDSLARERQKLVDRLSEIQGCRFGRRGRRGKIHDTKLYIEKLKSLIIDSDAYVIYGTQIGSVHIDNRILVKITPKRIYIKCKGYDGTDYTDHNGVGPYFTIDMARTFPEGFEAFHAKYKESK